MNTTLGVIFGNRDFFPDHLVTEAREKILAVFREMHIDPVMLAENEIKLGSVETYAHSRACAELFKANRERFDGNHQVVFLAVPTGIETATHNYCGTR